MAWLVEWAGGAERTSEWVSADAQAASAPGTAPGELLSVGRLQVLGLRVCLLLCLSALGRHSRLEEWEGLCFGFEGSNPQIF